MTKIIIFLCFIFVSFIACDPVPQATPIPTPIPEPKPDFDPTSPLVTVVGNDNSPYFDFSDNAEGLKVKLFIPMGVAVDSVGNIFISDTFNKRIRKAELSQDGTYINVKTLVGTGTKEYISAPYGIICDSAGNIYFTEADEHKVRKLTKKSDGSFTLSTIAGNGSRYGDSGDGGPGTSAVIVQPLDVAVDSAGNVFISDGGSHRIRFLPSTKAGYGNISTIAGTGTEGFSGDGDSATKATLRYPRGVALDSAGNLFIADLNNNRIRMVHKKTDGSYGIITTIAGNGIQGHTGDGGSALEAAFFSPEYLAFSPAGNLYVTEPGELYIRKIERNLDGTFGTVSSVAGTGVVRPQYGEKGWVTPEGTAAQTSRLMVPKKLSFAPGWGFGFAEAGTHRIRKITNLVKKGIKY